MLHLFLQALRPGASQRAAISLSTSGVVVVVGGGGGGGGGGCGGVIVVDIGYRSLSQASERHVVVPHIQR